MTRENNEVEQAVARTVRDSLERLQRSTDELNHAVSDLVAACASSRPANSLPPMMRAQTAAASLSASLDVLSRFVSSSLQMSMRQSIDVSADTVPEPRTPAVPPARQQPQAAPIPQPVPVAQVVPTPALPTQAAPTMQALPASNGEAGGSAPEMPEMPEMFEELMPVPLQLEEPVLAAPITGLDELPPEAAAFDVSALPVEEQELHRRANRVAKVSMQDIKLLRPNDVKVGKDQKDLCVRLRDDIEKAHREYDRRFQSILGHPVDYFYDWMVEILGDGNPEALGEYPYPSPVLRH
jgi:hypothetical protein